MEAPRRKQTSLQEIKGKHQEVMTKLREEYLATMKVYEIDYQKELESLLTKEQQEVKKNDARFTLLEEYQKITISRVNDKLGKIVFNSKTVNQRDYIKYFNLGFDDLFIDNKDEKQAFE